MSQPRPPGTEAALEQAWTLLTTGEPAAARAIYDGILRSDPLNQDAVFLLGIAHAELNDLPTALRWFQEITTLDPLHAEGWFQRGVVSLALARFEEAADSLRHFLRLRPDEMAGLMQYGYLLTYQGQYAAALPYLARVVATEPNNTMAQNLYAIALMSIGQFDAAKAGFRRLTAIDPDGAQGWASLGFLHLLLGEYAAGWPLYEWRAVPDPPRPAGHTPPRWDGRTDLRGKTLLLHTDAAFGDMIQFCRFAPLAVEAGARVILAMQEPLVRLMRNLPGVAETVVNRSPLPPHDLSYPVMSLAFAFGITLDKLPGPIPYLWPMTRSVEAWKARIAHLPQPRVGLAWAAAPRPGEISLQAFSQRKSMALAALAPLAGIPDVTFVMLQIGEAAGQARHPPPGMIIHDFTGYIQDFEDTAGMIANLDLVISVDTSVAHLAGAMGRPVWLMNLFDTDWRWMLDRDDSPWYPTMRIFRQPRPGDWDSVAQAVADALAELTANFKRADKGFERVRI